VISPRWLKILRDLWSNKVRTVLVIFSIAIGVTAIGIVLSTYRVITSDLPSQYAKVVPAHGTLVAGLFNDDLIRVIKSIDGVKDAEGRFNLQVRAQIGPEEWKDLSITVIPNFQDIRINKIFPKQGSWPPEEREIIIERSSLSLLQSKIGDSILIETPEGVQRKLKIVGLGHDLGSPAGTFSNQASGFITLDTLDWLGYPKNYNQLLFTAEGENLTRPIVRDLAYKIQEKIEKGGRTVYSTTIPKPDQHWFIPYLTPMASILTVLGFLMLLLSGLLIVNTISALLTQQTRQIGIMKAIGARDYQVMMMYLISMVIVGVFAFAIAVPFSWLGTNASVNVLASYINFDVNRIQIPSLVIWLQATLSILLPVLVALVPILKASRITVREAISEYGLSKVKFGFTWIDRLLGAIRGLSRPLMLSLRNTFRRKVRLVLTLLTLTLGSAIFMAVMSVNTSVIHTLDNALEYYGFDLVVMFNRQYRVDQILSEIDRVPGIKSAETWGITNSRLVNADGSESNNILLVAPPTNTKLIKPSVLDGRWLLPDDENAVVINSDVLREKPELKVGDPISLNIDGNESSWKIVGITRSVLTGPWIYTNYPYFARRLGRFGLSSAVYVALDEHDRKNQIEMSKILEEHFDRVGLRVSSIGKVFELRSVAISQFRLIFLFLMLMAVLFSIVGSFSLMGTMSLNILERTREIGIMRAIGASSGAVMQIVIFEGILIGLISWFLGMLISIPLSQLLGSFIGAGFLQSPLILKFSFNGVIIWLIIMVVIAGLASFLPAYNATRLTVRDVLAYE